MSGPVFLRSDITRAATLTSEGPGPRLQNRCGEPDLQDFLAAYGMTIASGRVAALKAVEGQALKGGQYVIDFMRGSAATTRRAARTQRPEAAGEPGLASRPPAGKTPGIFWKIVEHAPEKLQPPREAHRADRIVRRGTGPDNEGRRHGDARQTDARHGPRCGRTGLWRARTAQRIEQGEGQRANSRVRPGKGRREVAWPDARRQNDTGAAAVADEKRAGPGVCA